MSARSPSPARSAIATFASPAVGAAITRASPPGSASSRPVCRPSPPPRPRPEASARAAAKEKAPTRYRGLVWSEAARKSEPIVDAAAQQLLAQRHIVGDGRPAREAAVEAAKIDMEVFGLCRPIADNRGLHAGPDGPSEIGLAGAGESRCAGPNIAE